MHEDDDKLNPDHYKGLKPEPWDVMEAWGLTSCYYKATALKYLARAGKKPGESEADDLGKCIAFLQRRLAQLSGETAATPTPAGLDGAFTSVLRSAYPATLVEDLASYCSVMAEKPDEYLKLSTLVKSGVEAGLWPEIPTDEQRADFAYGNTKLHNEGVTRDMAEAAARLDDPQDKWWLNEL